MKIRQIQQTLLESNIPKRYITNKMRSGIESLLTDMNSDLLTEKKGDNFYYTVITKLKHKNGYIFEDDRRLTEQISNDRQMCGFSSLKFGKTELDIDNKNGEIIYYKKPFYKSWFMVLKKAEKVLNVLKKDYSEPSVTKETLKLRELTLKGEKKIKRTVLDFEMRRLQDVTEQLKKEVSQ